MKYAVKIKLYNKFNAFYYIYPTRTLILDIIIVNSKSKLLKKK